MVFRYLPAYGQVGFTNEACTALTPALALAWRTLSSELNAAYLIVGGAVYTPTSGWDAPWGCRTTSDGGYYWSGTTTVTAAVDTGFARNAAGVAEVNNGTTGTFRDLKARNLITNPTTVASLTAAATAGNGARSFVTDATSTYAAGVGTAVVGGGGNNVPVYVDVNVWKIG